MTFGETSPQDCDCPAPRCPKTSSPLNGVMACGQRRCRSQAGDMERGKEGGGTHFLQTHACLEPGEGDVALTEEKKESAQSTSRATGARTGIPLSAPTALSLSS